MVEGLVAFEGITVFAVVPVFPPPFALGLVLAVPTKLHALFLQRACDERAADLHSFFALASVTPAVLSCVVRRAEPAGKTADADFWIMDLHWYPSYGRNSHSSYPF